MKRCLASAPRSSSCLELWLVVTDWSSLEDSFGDLCPMNHGAVFSSRGDNVHQRWAWFSKPAIITDQET